MDDDDEYRPYSKLDKKSGRKRKLTKTRKIHGTKTKNSIQDAKKINFDKDESGDDPKNSSDIEWMIDLIQREDDSGENRANSDVGEMSDDGSGKVKIGRTQSVGQTVDINAGSRFLVVDVVRTSSGQEPKVVSNRISKLPDLILTDKHQFKWLLIAPAVEIKTFLSHRTLSIHSSAKKPIDYFNLLFTGDFLGLIVEGTNSYAAASIEIDKCSADNKWDPLDGKELKQFLALLFAMGLIRMETIADYWEDNPLFAVPGLSSLMPLQRFLDILKYFCFTRLKKVSDYEESILTILTFFENQMECFYKPGQNLHLWKPINLGAAKVPSLESAETRCNNSKLCILSESGCEIFLRAEIRLGKFTDDDQAIRNAVAINLTNPFAGRWHRLFTDEYYTSVQLAVNRFESKIYCTGLLRSDCWDIPQILKNVQLKKGQCSQTFLDNGLCIVKWNNVMDRYMLSADLSGRLSHTSSDLAAPEMYVHQANTINVSIAERLKFIKHPCVKEIDPLKHLAILVFEMMLNNACELYNLRQENPRQKMTVIDFRKMIIEKLVA